MYNIIGAFTFRALEGLSGDYSVQNAAVFARETTVEKLWNVTLALNVLEEPRWRTEVLDALYSYQRKLVPLIRTQGYRGLSPLQAWTIPASLMYSLSVYTTIGKYKCLIYCMKV